MTNTETQKNTKKNTLSEAEIDAKLRASFTGLSDSNITILMHYLYKYPAKWRSEDEFFLEDVNKLLPEAFAYNMRPSNALFGAVITIVIILLIGIVWWIISAFTKKNNKNVLNDPTIVNPAFI